MPISNLNGEKIIGLFSGGGGGHGFGEPWQPPKVGGPGGRGQGSGSGSSSASSGSGSDSGSDNAYPEVPALGRLYAEYLGENNNIAGKQLRIIPNYIYFYHLDKFCVLPLYPDSFTDNMSANFSSQNALARTAPVFSYSNSGPREVSISLILHRDMMEDLNRGISNLKENVVDINSNDYIDTLVKYLQSAALPKYQIYKNGSKSVIPPMVAIRFGNTAFIKGVINSGIQVTYEKPIMVDDKYAKVTVGFTVSEVDPYDAESVAKLGSFRGVCFANNIYR